MTKHDSFDDAILALRTAEATAPTDRLAIAAAKDAADRERLGRLALDISAQRIADLEREYENRAIVDAAKLKAAEELGVSVHELRLVECSDEDPVSYAPPDAYAAAIRALQEKERGR